MTTRYGRPATALPSYFFCEVEEDDPALERESVSFVLLLLLFCWIPATYNDVLLCLLVFKK